MTEWLSGMREEEAKAWVEVMLAHAFEESEWKSGRDRLQKLSESRRQASGRRLYALLFVLLRGVIRRGSPTPCHRWWKNCTANTGWKAQKIRSSTAAATC